MRKTKIKRIPFSTNKLFPILILVATIFMGVGYASINSIILNINGEVVAKAQDGIYITEVEYVSDVNANLIESKILSAYQTLLNSNIILSDVDPNSSITYKIAIYNSSEKNYIFDGVSYDKEFYSNDNITYSLTGLDIGYELYSKNTVVFYITFKYIDDILLSESITQLESYLKFNFVEAVETTLIYEDASIKKLTPLDTGYITFDEKEIVQGTIVRCNQNAVPIYDSYLVSANNVTVPTTCQVFDTLKESIETSDDTVNNLLMIGDENATEEIQLSTTKTINLDINGKTNISTITGETEETSIYIINNGIFTIKDSLNTGLMQTNYYMFINYGTLTINSGNYKKENANSTIGSIVKTYTGEVNINNAKLESDKTYVVFTTGSEFTELKIKNSTITSGGSSGGAVSNVGSASIISIMNSTVSNSKNGAIYGNIVGGDTFVCGSNISGGNYDILVNSERGGSVQYTSNNIFTDGTSNPVVSAPIEYDVVKNNLGTCIDDWYRIKDTDGNNVKYANGKDVLVGHKLQVVSSLSSILVMDNDGSVELVGNRLWTYEPWEESNELVDAQRFIFLPSNELELGYYNLAMYYYSDFYVGNFEGTNANNNQVALISSGNDNKGKFKIEKNGANKYAFKSYYDTCIDIPSASTTPSTYLQMYKCNQTNAQSWNFVRFN